MKTLRDYILEIENTELDGLPFHQPALFERDPPFAFANLNSSQKLLVILLWGNSDERHLVHINTLLKSKPEGVTWQDMLDACFTAEMRQAPNALLRRRNRTE